MNKLLVALISTVFFANVAFAAASDCEAKAVDKNGKALAGAAKTASIKKCEGAAAKPAAAADTGCEAKAVGKNGKPLAGAAKKASIKKCEADAKK